MISKRIQNKLNDAIELARHSEHPTWKLGAVLFKNNKILSRGVNKFQKTNPNMTGIITNDGEHFNRSIHAEHQALMEHRHHDTSNGASMAVARIIKSGMLRMARPCNNCQRLLREAGIKRVYYTIAENEYGVMNF